MNVHSVRFAGKGMLMIKDKRSVILQRARKLIAEKGYYSTSIKDIARASGVAQGTPYLYFKNKEELALKLAIELINENDALMDKALNEPGTLEEKLKSVALVMLRHVYKNREFAALLIRDMDFVDIKPDKKSRIIIEKKQKTEARIHAEFKKHWKNKEKTSKRKVEEISEIFLIIMEGIIKRVMLGKFKNLKNAEDFVLKVLEIAVLSQI
jgi:hypothetical protein